MAVRLDEITINKGEDLNITIDKWRTLLIRVHSDGRCFVLLPLAGGKNIFELTPTGLVESSEEEYLNSK